MRGVESRGVSIAAVKGPSLGGVRGGIDALNASIPIGRISVPLNEGPVSLRHINLGWQPIDTPRVFVSKAKTGNLPSGPEAVEIAEQWLSVARRGFVTQVLVNEPRDSSPAKPVQNDKRMPYLIRPAVLPLYYPEPVVKSKNEPKIQPKTDQIEFSKTAPQVAIFTELNKKSTQENGLGQNLTEEILVTKKVDEKPQVLEKEEVEQSRLKNVLDEEVAEQRIYEISQAIDQVEIEASGEGKEEINGSLILKLIRIHIGLISRIARKIRKDGSLDETLEELASRKFSSKDQAKQQTRQLVFEKEPVRRGKEGKSVKEGAVERIFKYLVVKGWSAKEQTVERVVKKQARRASPYEAAPVAGAAVPAEKKLEDYPNPVAAALKPAA